MATIGVRVPAAACTDHQPPTREAKNSEEQSAYLALELGEEVFLEHADVVALAVPQHVDRPTRELHRRERKTQAALDESESESERGGSRT